MKRTMHDQVAVVTGAGQGLGQAIAVRLAEEGCHVAVVDINQLLAEKVAGQVGSLGRKARVFIADMSVWDAVADLARQVVEIFGQADILINNVGWPCPGGPIQEQSVAVWEKSMLLNLTTQFFGCKAFVPHMVGRGYGRIVNVSSMAGKEGNPNLIPYSAAKSGVIGLTKALGKELATTGVLVNCICPAVIETEGAKLVGAETQKMLISKIPMGRMGRPEEVAALVAYLSSPDCSFSTGAVYDISGGRATY
ncbi:MAG: SDR family oxidoreductase [Acidimicrobiia bacterium]|nr:SDR family oxidoreductase [Acidimicrobiia bacterium]